MSQVAVQKASFVKAQGKSNCPTGWLQPGAAVSERTQQVS